MRFQAINEIEQFSFDDCQIGNVEIKPGLISFEAEALIVKPRNSQNEQFTESYAATTLVRFEQGVILSAVEDGYKRYDAADRLVEEAPDRSLSEEEWLQVLKKCDGYYLYAMDFVSREGDKQVYELSMESDEENATGVLRSYRFMISFEKSIFGWDAYMNRVQH